MKLLIVLTLCLGFVACSPNNIRIFIEPSESGSEPVPMRQPLMPAPEAKSGKTSKTAHALPEVIHDEVKIKKN